MELKKKEDQSVDALVLLGKVNKILTEGNMETKRGTETDRKAIQRLPTSRDCQEVFADRSLI